MQVWCHVQGVYTRVHLHKSSTTCLLVCISAHQCVCTLLPTTWTSVFVRARLCLHSVRVCGSCLWVFVRAISSVSMSCLALIVTLQQQKVGPVCGWKDQTLWHHFQVTAWVILLVLRRLVRPANLCFGFWSSNLKKWVKTWWWERQTLRIYYVFFSPLRHYLSWLWVDHAHDVLPVLHPSVVVRPAARSTRVLADVVALAAPQTQVHVTDAPPELGVPPTVTTLALLRPAPWRHPAPPPAHTCCPDSQRIGQSSFAC